MFDVQICLMKSRIVKTKRFLSGTIIPKILHKFSLRKTCTIVRHDFKLRTAHHLTSSQPPSRLDGSC